MQHHAVLFYLILLYFFSSDMKYNFNKINTLNQGTSYDYNSVMQYHKYAQSFWLIDVLLMLWCRIHLQS